MTRKRAVKLLMARGCSRNHANSLMRTKPPGHSNESHYRRITLVRYLRDGALSFVRLSALARYVRLAMVQLAQAIIEIKGGPGL